MITKESSRCDYVIQLLLGLGAWICYQQDAAGEGHVFIALPVPAAGFVRAVEPGVAASGPSAAHAQKSVKWKYVQMTFKGGLALGHVTTTTH